MRALVLVALLSSCVPQSPPQSTVPMMSMPIPNPPEHATAADKRLERVRKAIDDYLATHATPPSDEAVEGDAK